MPEFNDHYVIFADKDCLKNFRSSQNVDDELERYCKTVGDTMFIANCIIYKGPYDDHLWEQMKDGGFTDNALPAGFKHYKTIPINT